MTENNDRTLTPTQRLAIAMVTTWHRIAAEDDPDWSDWRNLIRDADRRVQGGRRVDIVPAEMYASLCVLADWFLKGLESSSSDVDSESLLEEIERAFAIDG